MAMITEAAKRPWEDKPTPRSGGIQRKPLARGTAGTPDNFEFNLYRFMAGYSTPRHRHNFEQMRFGLSGALTYDPGKPVSAGSLVYFPEGAYYGPQENPVDSEILLLQYGGASGQGYLSQEQIISTRGKLAESGQFNDGVYTCYSKDGKKHNKDAVEAIYEHVFGRKVTYVAPRISESVKINTAAHSWVPSGDGIEEKSLAVFTERKVRAFMLRATRPAHWRILPEERQLVFTLSGEFSVLGGHYGPQTSLFSDKGEELALALSPGWEALFVTLPLA